MKRTLLLLTVLLLGTQSFADDIKASYANSSFEKIFQVDKLQAIEMWEQPKTQYTPKNLRTEQQMRFNGRTSTGVASYTLHMTDYDTYITESYFKDGKFYVKDNTGKSFQTGELQQIDTLGIETAISNNTTKIENNTKAIKEVKTQVRSNTKAIYKVQTQVQSNTQNINALKNGMSRVNTRMDSMQSQIDRLDNRLEQGLATVTALTALHPNPRHQGKTQISIGAGMYADNVAGAVGVFHYLNDKVMLSAGASYGGDSSFAGNVGITIGF